MPTMTLPRRAAGGHQLAARDRFLAVHPGALDPNDDCLDPEADDL